MPLTEPKLVNEMGESRDNGEWTWRLWGELGGLQHEETLQMRGVTRDWELIILR